MTAATHTAAARGFGSRSAVRAVWTLAVVLAVLVLLTLSVVAAHASVLVASNPDTINIDAQAAQSAEPATYSRQVSADAAAVSADDARQAGFQVADNQTVWGTTTAVDLFKAEYASPDGAAVTVRSQDGGKVVAPGTSNSYTFAVRNTGEVPMTYQMTANVERGGSDDIPLELELIGPDGAQVDSMGQQGTLAAGESAQYALRWEWPFDRGADVADTQLGQAALSQQLSYTVEINTLAAVDASESDAAGDAGASADGSAVNTAAWLTQTGDVATRIAVVAAILAALSVCVTVVAHHRRTVPASAGSPVGEVAPNRSLQRFAALRTRESFPSEDENSRVSRQDGRG